MSEFDAEKFFEDFDQAQLDRLRAAAGGAEVDVDRLHDVIINAIGSHPDREVIIELLAEGMHPFVKPTGDDFELSIGYFDHQSLNPPGAEAGKGVLLGMIPLGIVLQRPQG
jgi:hypothetical protein